ncbi:MAG: hypothetical protein GF313_15890 [Caldithrix sp.]|nr:hypothetical protein [Caldithrix sp.]
MKPTPFNEQTDRAPIPFTQSICETGQQMKQKGLTWQPHAGCFVWDAHGNITVPSPFPLNIYFILNLGHFLKIFETVQNLTDKLVWLPTEHQALRICQEFSVSENKISDTLAGISDRSNDALLIALYRLIIENL